MRHFCDVLPAGTGLCSGALPLSDCNCLASLKHEATTPAKTRPPHHTTTSRPHHNTNPSHASPAIAAGSIIPYHHPLNVSLPSFPPPTALTAASPVGPSRQEQRIAILDGDQLHSEHRRAVRGAHDMLHRAHGLQEHWERRVDGQMLRCPVRCLSGFMTLTACPRQQMPAATNHLRAACRPRSHPGTWRLLCTTGLAHLATFTSSPH